MSPALNPTMKPQKTNFFGAKKHTYRQLFLALVARVHCLSSVPSWTRKIIHIVRLVQEWSNPLPIVVVWTDYYIGLTVAQNCVILIVSNERRTNNGTS